MVMPQDLLCLPCYRLGVLLLVNDFKVETMWTPVMHSLGSSRWHTGGFFCSSSLENSGERAGIAGVGSTYQGLDTFVAIVWQLRICCKVGRRQFCADINGDSVHSARPWREAADA